MSPGFALVSALVAFAAGAASAPDELCPKLTKFEHEARQETKPDEIEVFWDWSPTPTFACSHRNHSAGERLCSWLPKRVSWEFPGMLARRIGACYDLPGDKFGADKFPSQTTIIPLSSGGRLLMETGRAGPANLPRLKLQFVGTSRGATAGLKTLSYAGGIVHHR